MYHICLICNIFHKTENFLGTRENANSLQCEQINQTITLKLGLPNFYQKFQKEGFCDCFKGSTPDFGRESQ